MYIPEFVKAITDKQLFEGLSVINVVSSVFVFILGFIVYGLLAGVSGAMVSKIEEMAEGMKLFSFAMIIGAYIVIAYMSTAMTGNDWGVVTNFVYLFPLCSPFIVPASLFLGKMSVGLGLLSVGILLVTMVLLLYFVSGIYEYLIYYSGAPLKLKELIKLFRKKGGAK
jgi:ABC-2 type transport system permease protein